MAAFNQERKVKGVVDIVFLLDVSGSMQPCIDALKTNISTFIDTLTTKNANNQSPVEDWRAAVIGFRDAEADKSWFEDKPFVRDANELKAQLTALKAEGGDDEPESLLDALFKVISKGQTDKGGQEDATKWRYRSDAARVVIVFTDASFKLKMSIPEAKGGTVDDIVNLCHANRIILSIFAPEMDCFNPLSAIDKSEWEAFAYDKADDKGAQKALADYTANKDNFRRTLEQLAKSVSKSAAAETL